MAMKPNTYIVKVGRDSKDGKFITVKEAQRRHDTAEVQHIKIPRDKDR